MLTYHGVTFYSDEELIKMSLLDDLKGGVAAFHDALTALRGHLYNHPDPAAGLSDAEVQSAIDKVNGMATEVSDLHNSMTQQAAAAQAAQSAEDNSADDLNKAEEEQIGQANQPLDPPPAPQQ